MRFFSTAVSGVLCLLCALALPVMAADVYLARGSVVGIDEQRGRLSLKGYASAFALQPEAFMLWHGKKRPLVLQKGMEVSLYGTGPDAVARVEVHGPYSLMRQIDSH